MRRVHFHSGIVVHGATLPVKAACGSWVRHANATKVAEGVTCPKCIAATKAGEGRVGRA